MNNLILRSWVRVQMFRQALKRNTKGQDLIEYAMLAGFVAVAGAAILPGIATSISQIMSKTQSTLVLALGTP